MRILPLIVLSMLILSVSCAKTVPMAEPFDPARDLKRANEKLDDNREEEARRLLENIIRLDSTGEYAPVAQLRLADSYVMEDLPDLAVEEFEEFLRLYPRHKYASYAKYQIGMVYFRLINGPDRGFGSAVKALQTFEQLNGEFPRNPYRDDVLIKIEQCKATIAEHEYRVGDFYFQKDACKGAIGRLEDVRRDFPNYAGMSRVLYRMAICYEKLGMAPESQEALDTLTTRFPASGLYDRAIEAIQEYREGLASREPE